MARRIDMPKLSPTMEEGQIASWHKEEGDSVEVDDLLAEVETDKATMEFRSFDRGTLLKILRPAGSIVRLGDPVAVIGAKGDDISELVAGTDAGEAEPDRSNAGEATTPEQGPPSGEAAATDRPPTDTGSVDATGRVKASPYVRKLAREQGVDLHRLAGSGPGGRIIAADLGGAGPISSGPATEPAPARSGKARTPAARPAATIPSAASTPTPAAGDRPAPTTVPLSMMRRTIARRLTESKQSVPHFYLTVDVDAAPIATLREQLNADLAHAHAQRRGEGAPPKLSINDLLVKACAIGLCRVPAVNASFSPNALLMHNRVDISVAVAIDDGLVTPVVRDADRKSVVAIGSEIRELAARARAKRLSTEEMTDGTFSISNLGMYGIDDFAAVINPPEGAILAVGTIRQEPVVDPTGQVVAGQRMRMTLSCDHRVVDGAVGSSFLAELRVLLQTPTQILAL